MPDAVGTWRKVSNFSTGSAAAMPATPRATATASVAHPSAGLRRPTAEGGRRAEYSEAGPEAEQRQEQSCARALILRGSAERLVDELGAVQEHCDGGRGSRRATVSAPAVAQRSEVSARKTRMPVAATMTAPREDVR